MEQAGKYNDKLNSFRAALDDFNKSMQIDLSESNPVITDAIENGQIQKFEFTTELLWKTLRAYLLEIHGIEKNSPKFAIKEFLNVRDINEDVYNTLFDMIDDRNLLSHTYSEKDFKVVHKKLPDYLQVLKKVLDTLENIK
jgi:nucleotidyltransferase substrate binding protein (TIGR01987 family)